MKAKLYKFFAWLFNEGYSHGVIMNHWLTDEEKKACEEGGEARFWSFYHVALQRKSDYDFKEGFKRFLVWIVFIGVLAGLYTFAVWVA